MAPPADESGTDIRSEVRELAKSMREGLDRRREWRACGPAAASPSGVSPEDFQALRSKFDLLNLPPLAKHPRWSWVVLPARRLLRLFLRPWLAVQTDFNRHAVEVMQSLYRELNELQSRIERHDAERGESQAR